MKDKNDNNVHIQHNEDDRRYTISYDGSTEPAGYLEYEDRNGERVFTHTIVDKQYGGRGLAGLLVKVAAEDTSSRGWPIVAQCSYVESWMEKNDYAGEWRKP